MKKEKIIFVVLIFCIMIVTSVFAENVAVYDEDIDIGDKTEGQGAGDINNYRYERNSDGPKTVTLTEYIGVARINYIPQDLDGKFDVTRVADELFAGSTNLYQAGIQDGIRILGKGVFKNCFKMSQAAIGTGITIIPEDTFYGGINLKRVSGGENVTEIKSRAFYNCNSLINMELSNNIKKIGDQAFFNCRYWNIKSLPANVETIGSEAFKDCEYFNTNVLVMPTTVKSIGNSAFENTQINYMKFSNENLPTIGNDVFGGTILLPLGWREKYNNSTKGYEKYNIMEMFFGDANNDNFINSTDAAMVLDIFKNDTSPEDEVEFMKIDMNGDGALDSTDAAMILDIFKNS